MLQIIYISTARQPLSREELDVILAVSRRNNAAAGVTGLLVAGGRRFLQALEGPEAAVMTTMKRIQADPRHFAIVELSRRIVDTRSFGTWDMACERGGDAGTDDLQSDLSALIRPLEDRTLRAQFESFAALHARAA
jgi:hypothetical protein